MTIQEVIRNGGNFKRIPWMDEDKIQIQEFAPFCHFFIKSNSLDLGDTVELAVEDILADDWENKP
jgi:hypothetical protein